MNAQCACIARTCSVPVSAFLSLLLLIKSSFHNRCLFCAEMLLQTTRPGINVICRFLVPSDSVLNVIRTDAVSFGDECHNLNLYGK